MNKRRHSWHNICLSLIFARYHSNKKNYFNRLLPVSTSIKITLIILFKINNLYKNR